MKIKQLPHRLALETLSFRASVRAGLFRLDPPAVFARGVAGMRKYGPMGGVMIYTAARYPDRIGVIDELGSLTYAELDARSNALANTWVNSGFEAGGGIAIMVRNHRGFVDASFAAAKIGARVVYLNTDFGGPAIADVCEREGVDILVCDQQYAGLLDTVSTSLGTYLAWIDDADAAGDAPTLESAISAGSAELPPVPEQQAKIIILTSGTTGKPKGTERPNPKSLIPVGGLFDKVRGYSGGGVLEACPPFFHSLGYAQLMLGVTLGMTVVMRRFFDPQATLESLAANKVTMMTAVPVMLRRIVDLGPEAREGLDLSNLQTILAGGSQLGADVAIRVAEAFGPVLHNLYASTEVAYVSIASPAELALEPGTVGSPYVGSTVKILDDRGRELPTGQTGRIFVGNGVQFSGYTGGGGKEMIDGLMSSGDVGHFDEKGLLFVDGRDDEMIISGGENLFPGEIEELLAGHPDIIEVAAIGVPDEEYGSRLQVFVVRVPDSSLDADGVKEYVRSNLARFKVPREVVFLDLLPRNPAGKVLKRELVSLAD